MDTIQNRKSLKPSIKKTLKFEHIQGTLDFCYMESNIFTKFHIKNLKAKLLNNVVISMFYLVLSKIRMLKFERFIKFSSSTMEKYNLYNGFY